MITPCIRVSLTTPLGSRSKSKLSFRRFLTPTGAARSAATSLGRARPTFSPVQTQPFSCPDSRLSSELRMHASATTKFKWTDMRGQKGRRLWHDDPKDVNEKEKEGRQSRAAAQFASHTAAAAKVLKEFVQHFQGKSPPTAAATTTRILSPSQCWSSTPPRPASE